MKLFALANAHIDGDHSGDTPSPARTDASKIILNKLHADVNTRLIVEQMEQMCTGKLSNSSLNFLLDDTKYFFFPKKNIISIFPVLINLANKKLKGRTTISSQEPLLTLRNLNKIHCPTVKLNVSPSANYSNIVGISKYSNELMLPGGINEPKRIVCIGTDGKNYLQLLKGIAPTIELQFYYNNNNELICFL